MFSNYRRFFVLTQFRMISIFFVYFFLFRNAELFSPKYTKLFAAQKFVLSIHNRRRIDERNLYTQWVELGLENAHNCFYFSVISSTCKVWLNRCVINMLVLYMVCVWDGRCILPWNSIHWVCRLLYFTLSHILSLSIAFDLCVRCTVCVCVIGIVRRLCTCIDTILFFHFGVYTDSQSEWARERERWTIAHRVYVTQTKYNTIWNVFHMRWHRTQVYAQVHNAIIVGPRDIYYEREPRQIG